MADLDLGHVYFGDGHFDLQIRKVNDRDGCARSRRIAHTEIQRRNQTIEWSIQTGFFEIALGLLDGDLGVIERGLGRARGGVQVLLRLVERDLGIIH